MAKISRQQIPNEHNKSTKKSKEIRGKIPKISKKNGKIAQGRGWVWEKGEGWKDTPRNILASKVSLNPASQAAEVS